MSITPAWTSASLLLLLHGPSLAIDAASRELLLSGTATMPPSARRWWFSDTPNATRGRNKRLPRGVIRHAPARCSVPPSELRAQTRKGGANGAPRDLIFFCLRGLRVYTLNSRDIPCPRRIRVLLSQCSAREPGGFRGSYSQAIFVMEDYLEDQSRRVCILSRTPHKTSLKENASSYFLFVHGSKIAYFPQ